MEYSVLQINSIVDIGASYHSQFSALVYEFVDDTGFEPLPEMERGQGLDNIDAKPRRMLSFAVSDGETDLRAIEYYSIKSFSLLTKPGSKILLIPPVLCRKGVLLLKPTNVQLLGAEYWRPSEHFFNCAEAICSMLTPYSGGDVESFFMSGRPLQVMAEKLNVAIPQSKTQNTTVLRGELRQSKELNEPGSGTERSKGSKNSNTKPVVIPSGPEPPVLCDDDYDFDPAEYDQGEPPCGIEDVDMEAHDSVDQVVPDSVLTINTNENSRTSAVFPDHPITRSSERTYTKPVAQISPMTCELSKSEVEPKNRRCSIELEESPPDFDAELARIPKISRLTSSEKADNRGREAEGRDNRPANHQSPSTSEDSVNTRKRSSAARPSLISLCDSQAETSGLKQIPCASFDPTRRPVKLGIQGFLHTVSPPTGRQIRERETTSESTRKKVKVEVIDIEDDDDVIHDAAPLSSNLTQPCSSTQTESQTVKSPQILNRSFQSDIENDLVVKFKKLNIVRIADASKQMRFAVGSCRKTVQAIIVDIIDSLRIVDGLWTMKVSLQDESVDSFVCLIDSPTLSSLIGLTPAEALEVRASNDIERRKDGQRRLGAVEEQLKRLDLLMVVELFSGSRADPVIRSIRTLMQELDVS
ncbi:hypothetical protein COOONC_08812 [Cooperia oncophora]